MPPRSRFGSYVSVADRKARAALALARLTRKKGEGAPSPVTITGRDITTTFWGQAWCENLESYADFAYRLERGRSYVRGGAVVDLRIEAGQVTAQVMGSELYAIDIGIARLASADWRRFAKRCAGRVGSLIGLLRGELPDEVLRAVTDRQHGLFPAPKAITMRCSCPDAARLCKHVAATLYGVGARLDHAPELLFRLRGVDPNDLIEHATASLAAPVTSDAATLALPQDDLAALFGIELAVEAPPRTTASAGKAQKGPRKGKRR